MLSRSLFLATLVVGVLSGIVAPAASEEDDLELLIERVGHGRVTHNEHVELLWDPAQALERRLELLDSARHHIFLTILQWYDDATGGRFLERLLAVTRERRAADPEFTVLVLFDSTSVLFGTPQARLASRLREAGAEVRVFNSPGPGIVPVYDARLHEKVLVVDGRQVIVGGRNLGDRYLDPVDSWRDCDVLIRGPGAQEVQMHFLKAWTTARYLRRPGHLLRPHEATLAEVRELWRSGRFSDRSSPLEPFMTRRFFPHLDDAGPHRAAVLYDNSLVWPVAPTARLLEQLLDRATRAVDVMTPFPNLTRELTDALLRAAARGVRVRVLVNDEQAMVRDSVFWLAILPTLIELIDGGVGVWAWQGNQPLLTAAADLGCTPPILPGASLHAKLVRIDDRAAMVHSSNFNYRSVHYNTEIGALLLDPPQVAEVARIFDDLVDHPHRPFACHGAAGELAVEVRTLVRMDEARVPELHAELGRLSRFVESMSLLW